MRRITLFRILLTFSILVSLIFTKSCANTRTGPEGGPKDTIPPILVEILPHYNAVNHPTTGKHNVVSFEFDEYVALDQPGTNIFLSPPQSKPPRAKIKGKKIVVSFDEPLDSNQTYSLSLGNAVKDNNEGNKFPPFVHSFSTGEYVDSMFVSGSVFNATTMLPMTGITVLFHTDPSDSAIFNSLPKAAAKTDLWGYFTVRNLPADTVFRVFAIEDLNNNNKYDPDMERVAFVDTLVVPSTVMRYDLPELVARDMEDTLECLSRPSQLSLSLFKESSSRQFVKAKERPSRRQMYITFGAHYPQIDSIYIEGIPQDKILFEYNHYRDSIVLWINEQGGVHDTLRLMVDYLKTDDSLKVLTPAKDTFRMIVPKAKKEKNRQGRMVDVVDTVAKFELLANAEVIDQDGIIFNFATPMIQTPFDSIKITSVNTRQQEENVTFTVERDSLDIKKYILRLSDQLNVGYEYKLKFPGRQFVDINGFYCDSLDKKFSLPNDEKLSTLILEISNVPSDIRYMVELVDEKRSKTYRKYYIDSTASLSFPYLKAAKYSIRITEDKNGNGLTDTGILLERKQPEKVLMVKLNESLGNDAYIIEIPEMTELIQTIDLGEMFK